jgi:hypothetical protein
MILVGANITPHPFSLFNKVGEGDACAQTLAYASISSLSIFKKEKSQS